MIPSKAQHNAMDSTNNKAKHKTDFVWAPYSPDLDPLDFFSVWSDIFTKFTGHPINLTKYDVLQRAGLCKKRVYKQNQGSGLF